MADKPNIDALFNLRASFPTKEEVDAFFAAAKGNNLKALAQMVDKWPDATTKWRKSTNPVIVEHFKEMDEKTLAFLVSHGADIDGFENGQFWNPLHLAAYHGDLASVEKLIRAGAQVDGRNHCDMTPLKWAAEKGHQAIADLLVVCGANPYAGLDACKDDMMKEVITNAQQRRETYLKSLESQLHPEAPAEDGTPAPQSAPLPVAAGDTSIHIMRALEFKKAGIPLPREEAAPANDDGGASGQKQASGARGFIKRIFKF